MLVGLGKAVDLFGHVGDDAQTQFLGFLAFAVMLADEGDEAFRQADEADGKRTLVEHGLDGVVLVKFLAAKPQAGHKERELLLEGGLLELEALVQLTGGDFQGPVQLLEEHLQSLFLVGFLVHGLDGQFHDIDGGEAEVAAADRGLGTELVTVHTRTAAHGPPSGEDMIKPLSYLPPGERI